MFREEEAEDFYIGRIRNHTFSPSVFGVGFKFKVLEKTSSYELPDDISEYGAITPMCLFGIYEETIVQQLDAMGDSQITDFNVVIIYAIENYHSQGQGADLVYRLGRELKTIIRAQHYMPADGNAQGVTKCFYDGAVTLNEDGGVIVRAQRYRLRVMDYN